MKQNITLSLDKDIIRRARLVAAQRGTSISTMLADELTRLVEKTEQYQHAHRQALALLEEGFHMGGKPLVNREELHER